MNSNIKFFSYRGCNAPNRYRRNSPAADSKIDYIIEVLNRCGYDVEHISKAYSASGHFIPAYVEQKGRNKYRYFASFDSKFKILRAFNRLLVELQFFFWCLFHLKRNETVIVYHSLGYASTWIKLQKLLNLNIIGEIEEVYQDVHKQRSSVCKAEYEFISRCSKYIFPTSLLNESVNTGNKPSIIVHGLYSVENELVTECDDGYIHVVYGGTLEPQKGGAAAAAAAAYLPKNYHVHICGFGDSTEIVNIIHKVSKDSVAKLTFEGELSGSAYKQFIQRCHIGLSTQNPNAAFNATSFPSKILVYLSNGLKVVSVRIPAIEKSAVADCVFFYDHQNPQEIAQAILSATSSDLDGRKRLMELDKSFERDLLNLLNN